MPDQPFDRTVLYPLEKPLAVDVNQAESQLDRSVRRYLYEALARRTSFGSEAPERVTGFVGNGLRVVPVSPVAMQVVVKAGLGFTDVPADVPAAIGGVVGLSDLESYKPLPLLADVTFAVPAAPAGPNTRIDIVEVRVNRVLGNPLSRQVLDPPSGTFSPNSLNKTLAFALAGSAGTVNAPAISTAALSYKVGVSANPGVVPPTTAGYIKVAEIRVGSAVASIGTADLVDRRPLLYPGGMVPFSGQWRLQYNGGSPIITALGIEAPTGVQVAAVQLGPGATRGEIEFYVVGGEMLGGTMDVNGYANTLIGINEAVSGYQSGGEPALLSATVGVQTELAAAVPPISVGQTTQTWHSFARARFQSGATTNNTNAALEDMRYTIAGHLHY